MADTIIAGTIVILSVLVVGYITYLRSVIELKMDDKPVSIQNMLFHWRLLFFHHKLNLDKNYPFLVLVCNSLTMKRH
jgi:hypothetical protein